MHFDTHIDLFEHLIFFSKYSKKCFPQIGQYGYPKAQNFMLFPNLHTKLRKSALKKSYYNFVIITSLSCLFSNFVFGFGISVKFCVFGTHIGLFEEKICQLFFWKNIKWSIILFSMVLFRSQGDANFFLKCHALYPICLSHFLRCIFQYVYLCFYT